MLASAIASRGKENTTETTGELTPVVRASPDAPSQAGSATSAVGMVSPRGVLHAVPDTQMVLVPATPLSNPTSLVSDHPQSRNAAGRTTATNRGTERTEKQREQTCVASTCEEEALALHPQRMTQPKRPHRMPHRIRRRSVMRSALYALNFSSSNSEDEKSSESSDDASEQASDRFGGKLRDDSAATSGASQNASRPPSMPQSAETAQFVAQSQAAVQTQQNTAMTTDARLGRQEAASGAAANVSIGVSALESGNVPDCESTSSMACEVPDAFIEVSVHSDKGSQESGQSPEQTSTLIPQSPNIFGKVNDAVTLPGQTSTNTPSQPQSPLPIKHAAGSVVLAYNEVLYVSDDLC